MAGSLNYESTNSYSVTVTARDPSNSTDTINVTISVANVNERPNAVNVLAIAIAAVPSIIDVLTNDSDPDSGTTLSVSATTDPANGAVSVNPDNTVTYTSDPTFSGEDSFTYTASDGSLTDSATVTVTVSNPCGNGTAVTDPASNPELLADCNILLSLGNSIKGTGNLNWSQDTAITDWDGITVAGDPKRVTKIDLDDKALDGYIPTDAGVLAALSTLIGLTEIRLNNNSLNGSIPAQLGNLPELIGFYAIDSGLSGNIPAELGNLPKLQELYLRSNSFDGNIPSQLGNITSLTKLNLSSNHLDGPIPASLGDLTNLIHLQLNNNNLDGNIPTELGNLSNLTHLILNSNGLDGSIPTTLGQLSELNQLQLQSNTLSGSVPAELGDLSKLDQLRINNNALTGDIPPDLGNLELLSDMFISTNNYSITTCIPGELAYVEHNDFADTGLPFSTNPVIADGDTATRTIAENTPAATHVGAPFSQRNSQSGTITWATSGTDAGAFTIDASSGQVTTKDPLNYEAVNLYSFTVIATNSDSETDEIAVTVDVSNVNEPPAVSDEDNEQPPTRTLPLLSPSWTTTPTRTPERP